MNQQTNPNDGQGGFGQSSQTNPFTADLKGEFSSNFGTGTSSVSQIFKEGAFAGSPWKKYALYAVIIIAAVGVVGYMYLGEGMDGGDDEISEVDTPPPAAPAPPPPVAQVPKAETHSPAAAAPVKQPTAAPAHSGSPAAAGTGALSLAGPAANSEVIYDETAGGAKFAWDGQADHIVFSHNSSMKPEILRAPVNGKNTYMSNHLYPGTWYWRVENASGASEARTFTVAPPARRPVSLTQPAKGATIAGNGGVVSWKTDNLIAIYRVELSTGDWANPPYVFQTSGSQIALSGVPAGSYQLRLGAFSEVAGRWEYQAPIPITVQ